MVNEINGTNSASTSRSSNKRASAESADNQQSTASGQTPASSPSEGLELSSQAQLLGRLEADIGKLPEIDPERVEAISNALNNGQFVIDDASLAQSIIDFEFK